MFSLNFLIANICVHKVSFPQNSVTVYLNVSGSVRTLKLRSHSGFRVFLLFSESCNMSIASVPTSVGAENASCQLKWQSQQSEVSSGCLKRHVHC